MKQYSYIKELRMSDFVLRVELEYVHVVDSVSLQNFHSHSRCSKGEDYHEEKSESRYG